jgi:hypothetical protein
MTPCSPLSFLYPALPAHPLLHFFSPFPDHKRPLFYNTALFKAQHSGTCFLLVQGFKDGPMGTEFQSSTYPLFPYIYIPVFRLAEHSACHLLARWFAEPIASTLKMETISSSETSVETQRTTRRHIPEDGTLQNDRCENLKPYKFKVMHHLV